MVHPTQPRALIVDDQAGIAALIEEALTLNGWECTVLTDPLRLESILAERFDLIICDYRMPGRTGLDVYRSACERQPDLARRFILMTGNPADAAKHQEELGGIPVLVKPFKLAQLLQAVERIR